MKEADFNTEIEYVSQGQRVAGLDEVGRGCWAGPLVAAAYSFTYVPTDIKVGDSKTIPEKQRILLAEQLKECGDWGIGEASNSEIDELGLQAAQFLAYERALVSLVTQPDVVLLDGRQVAWRPLSVIPGLTRDPGLNSISDLDPESEKSKFPILECIIDGDAKVASIAAASLIAKVYRDIYMQTTAHTLFPDYAFNSHVGYGTKAHQLALKAHGITPLHRKSFKPIQALLK